MQGKGIGRGGRGQVKDEGGGVSATVNTETTNRRGSTDTHHRKREEKAGGLKTLKY